MKALQLLAELGQIQEISRSYYLGTGKNLNQNLGHSRTSKRQAGAAPISTLPFYPPRPLQY